MPLATTVKSPVNNTGVHSLPTELPSSICIAREHDTISNREISLVLAHIRRPSLSGVVSAPLWIGVTFVARVSSWDDCEWHLQPYILPTKQVPHSYHANPILSGGAAVTE